MRGGRGLSTHRRARPPAGSHVSRLGREAWEDSGKGGCTGASHVRLPEPSSFLGKFCWQGLGAKTKAALSRVPNGNADSRSPHRPALAHATETSLVAPRAARSQDGVVKGLRCRSRQEVGLLLLGPTPVTVLNTGLLSPLVHESPTKQACCLFSMVRAGHGSWRPKTLGGGQLGGQSDGLGSQIPGFQSWLCPCLAG